MIRRRLIFYAIFTFYMASVFLFTILVDGYLDLFKLLKYIPWFKYLAFVGLLFMLIDFIWALWANKSFHRATEKLNQENKSLKARIYDLTSEGEKPKEEGLETDNE